MDYNPEIFAKPSPFYESRKTAIAGIKPAQNSHFMNRVPPPFQNKFLSSSSLKSTASVKVLYGNNFLQNHMKQIMKNGQRIPLNSLPRPKPKVINLCNHPEEEEKEPVKPLAEAERRDDIISNSPVQEERKLPEKLEEEPVLSKDFIIIQEEPCFKGYMNQLYQFRKNKGQSQGSYKEEQKCDLANQNNLFFKADEGYFRKLMPPIDEDKPEDVEQHNESCELPHDDDMHNMSDDEIEPVQFNLVDISAPPVTLGGSYLHQLKTLRKKDNGIKCSKPFVLKPELSLDYRDDQPPTKDMSIQSEIDIDLEAMNSMKLTMKIKKEYIHSNPLQIQSFPCTVSLAMDNLKGFKRTPIDLILLIDDGASMKEKIGHVTGAFYKLLEELDEIDRVSVIFFNEKAVRKTPLMRMTQPNKETVMKSFWSKKSQGNVDIGVGLDLAFRVLKHRRFKNQITSVFLFSSGADKIDQSVIKNSIGKLSAKDDIFINTFGLGKECDSELLAEIAKEGNGKFEPIHNFYWAGDCFVRCVKNLVCSVAKNARISVKAEQSAILNKVELVNNLPNAGTWNCENEVYSTFIPNIIADGSKDFMFEIRIPPNQRELVDHEKSIKIASAECVAMGLNGKKIVKKVELHITLLNMYEEILDDDNDQEVMMGYYDAVSINLINKAEKLVGSGKEEDAVNLLEWHMEEEILNAGGKTDGFEHFLDHIKEVIKGIKVKDLNIFNRKRSQIRQEKKKIKV